MEVSGVFSSCEAMDRNSSRARMDSWAFRYSCALSIVKATRRPSSSASGRSARRPCRASAPRAGTGLPGSGPARGAAREGTGTPGACLSSSHGTAAPAAWPSKVSHAGPLNSTLEDATGASQERAGRRRVELEELAQATAPRLEDVRDRHGPQRGVLRLQRDDTQVRHGGDGQLRDALERGLTVEGSDQLAAGLIQEALRHLPPLALGHVDEHGEGTDDAPPAHPSRRSLTAGRRSLRRSSS